MVFCPLIIWNIYGTPPSLDFGQTILYYLESIVRCFSPFSWNIYVGILPPPPLGFWTNHPLLPRIYSLVFCPLYLEYICWYFAPLDVGWSLPYCLESIVWCFAPFTWNIYVGIFPLFGCWMKSTLLPRIYSLVFCPLYLEYICWYFAPLWMLDGASLITWNMYVGILPLFGCWMKPSLSSCPLCPCRCLPGCCGRLLPEAPAPDCSCCRLCSCIQS